MKITPLSALVLVGSLSAQESLPAQETPSDVAVEWDARAAEHLLNRAGFGATSSEVEAAVEAGLVATVERLLAGPDEPVAPFFAEHLTLRDGGFPDLGDDVGGGTMRGTRRAKPDTDDPRVAEAIRRMQGEDKRQMFAYAGWWVERMIAAEDPLRERMALFWHGHFTSSFRDVKSSFEMIQQNTLLREGALGSFGDLVAGIARDPAMLEYLDNDANKKGRPNENFARELLELFTLGEGNYTEADVKDVARAFTGWTDRRGDFYVSRAKHDGEEKTVLGVTGDLSGDDVIRIVLEQEACARYLATELIQWFEGVDPTPERVEAYAALLRENDYELAPMLERLFLDPAFYREEVRAARVASPVDFLVGHCRRLGLDGPSEFVTLGSRVLGERLFDPPSVKGWEGGMAWISTSTLMNRGNLAGVLLGVVDVRDILRDREIEAEMMEEGAGSMEMARMDMGRDLGTLKKLERALSSPNLNLTAKLARAGASSDAEIVDALLDELLAISAPADTRNAMRKLLRDERKELGVKKHQLLEAGQDGEKLLRRLAHLILCLPEAQLH